ncbi:MAG: type II toxin-antitoxin system VapC family toxin [Pyrinomonadaceae bacterium]
MKKPKLYIETSILSYLTARRSRDLFIEANQRLAAEFWNNHRKRFQLFVSDIVIREISRGDAVMAKLRLEAAKGIPLIEADDHARKMAGEIIRRGILPEKAFIDASHIAVCCVHEIDFLLSLNFRHIANAFIHRRIEDVCKEFGYEPPVICTLEQILEKENRIDD